MHLSLSTTPFLPILVTAELVPMGGLGLWSFTAQKTLPAIPSPEELLLLAKDAGATIYQQYLAEFGNDDDIPDTLAVFNDGTNGIAYVHSSTKLNEGEGSELEDWEVCGNEDLCVEIQVLGLWLTEYAMQKLTYPRNFQAFRESKLVTVNVKADPSNPPLVLPCNNHKNEDCDVILVMFGLESSSTDLVDDVNYSKSDT